MTLRLVLAVILAFGCLTATAKTVNSSQGSQDQTSVAGVAGPAAAAGRNAGHRANVRKNPKRKPPITPPPAMHDPN